MGAGVICGPVLHYSDDARPLTTEVLKVWESSLQSIELAWTLQFGNVKSLMLLDRAIPVGIANKNELQLVNC